jgi:hypothetical protein
VSRPITAGEQAVLPQDFTAIYVWTGVVALVLIALAVACLVMADRVRKVDGPLIERLKRELS